MIDHAGVAVRDHGKSRAFYVADLKPIGYSLLIELPPSVTGHADVAGFGEPPKADFRIRERLPDGSALLQPNMIEQVLHFWFVETTAARWWRVDAAFDAVIAERFSAVHAAAVAGEMHGWRAHPRGRLAEILVLDQFSRNLYRGQARAFAADPMALLLAQEAVAGAHDISLSLDERVFLYLPYMHSESRLVHVEAERLFASLGRKESLDFELRHKAIIDRFGRYPHRNAALGRASTPEELEFLKQPGSSF